MADRSTDRMRRAAAAIAVVAVLGLAGCSGESGGLLDDYDRGGGGYISGDGTVFVPEEPGEPVDFAGETDQGTTISSEELRGGVAVVNFWYAACPPCRVEAADLEELHREYADAGVAFVGVNVRDAAATARTFADEFGVTYPSILDAESNDVQLAFAGQVAPNAVPTTLVLDREGRVTARISGLVSDPALLATFIDDALGENG